MSQSGSSVHAPWIAYSPAILTLDIDDLIGTDSVRCVVRLGVISTSADECRQVVPHSNRDRSRSGDCRANTGAASTCCPRLRTKRLPLWRDGAVRMCD